MVKRKYILSAERIVCTVKNIHRIWLLMAAMAVFPNHSFAQKIYFADGYHGGVYGHYPIWQTQFMVDMLQKNPHWKINIEIEPETWDTVQVKESSALNEFKALFENQSASGRIEYTNPAYAQSYLFNIPGESIIRQFSYGIKKVKQYFPAAVFSTYSSEEPCFTSALPQILKSFDFKYAVLKNPNTCWGGYTRAFGGELVNWIGPDGTSIPTVPRYAVESLQPNSTWQTIAWNNDPAYIKAALDYGIKHPVGMCLQDAGWRNGPWLGKKKNDSCTYITWRNYFENIAVKASTENWKLSQEDIQVSLVWGAQVLQRIAQQVRTAENKIITAEKMAVMAKIEKGTTWPKDSLDEAWRTLMLSQHHDCWIVPYNGKPGKTWADKVKVWTDYTNTKSNSIISQSALLFSQGDSENVKTSIRVFNTMGVKRKEPVTVLLPGNFTQSIKILDKNKKEIPSQIIAGDSDAIQLLFNAETPSFGYASYTIEKAGSPARKGAYAELQADGNYKLETDLYCIVIDPLKGGTIKSLTAKKLQNKEFADTLHERSFNELRGNFYEEGGFRSSKENLASIKLLENGPLQIKVQIEGTIASCPFVQTITLAQGQRRIDMDVKLNWNKNSFIGDRYKPDTVLKSTGVRKNFYDDQYKLLALFPLNLKDQKVYKNAPLDVTESNLSNTFFNSWDSIKNNIILNWVDITDGSGKYGMALLTDHTTSYAHGADFPLALTLQYSGPGLWGRNYIINGPTEIHYAILPHAGKWNNADIWQESDKWNEPLFATVTKETGSNLQHSVSLIDLDESGWELSASYFEGNDLIIRLFNAEGSESIQKITFACKADKIQLIELDGRVINDLEMVKDKTNSYVTALAIPKFGVRTIRLTNAKK